MPAERDAAIRWAGELYDKAERFRARAEAAEAQVARVNELHAKLREAAKAMLSDTYRPPVGPRRTWWLKDYATLETAIALDAKEPT
jgi:hypothetical protein